MNADKAPAAMQEALTQSEISVRVAENAAAGDLARATKDAERVKITAEADTRRIFALGESAGRQAAGRRLYGGPEYRLTEQVTGKLFQAIEARHQGVPQILVGGNGGEPGGSLDALLSGLLSSTILKLSPAAPDGRVRALSPAAE